MRFSELSAPKVSADLETAERQGVILAIILRTFILLVLLGILSNWVSITGNFSGILLLSAFLALGLVHYLLIRHGMERRWHRLLFVTFDIAGIALAAIFIPLTAAGDVPQIMVFRLPHIASLFLIVAIAALTLTPSVVIWAGVASTIALWTTFSIIVAGMERTISWDAMPRNPTREQFLAVYLDPDFVGRSSRLMETIILLGTALLLAVAVARARAVVIARAQAEEQRAQIQGVFGRYVPEEVAEEILKDGGVLSPTQRTASIVFVDIEGFTTLSESLPPDQLISILNAYFEAVTGIVERHGGVVVNYVGDAILIAFNMPVQRSAFAHDAVACGAALLDTTARSKFAGETLRIRIGIATGPVAAGSVGGAGRQTYTVYGDTVNLAQRLENENKQLGTRLLICEVTAARVAPSQALREVAVVDIRGRTQPVRLFTPAT